MCSILLIEDHADTRYTLDRVLRHWGHEVANAPTVHRGLALADSKAFDAILSDIGLPDGDGFGFIRAVQNTSSKSAVALAITAWTSWADQVKAKAAGFHHFFGKPIDLERLRTVLSTVL
jgi:DNA-binding response OmpR family regulator